MPEQNAPNEEVPLNNQSTGQKKKPYPPKATLSPEEVLKLDSRERILLPFALRRVQQRQDIPFEMKQRIFAQVPAAIDSLESSDFDTDKAIAAYGCERRQFYNKLADYVACMVENPDNHECWAESLGDNRGRPRGASHVATEAHRLATQAGVIIREQTGIHSDGSMSTVPLEPGLMCWPMSMNLVKVL